MKESWHLSKSVSLALIYTVICVIVSFTWYAANLTNHVQKNTDMIEAHENNKDFHMSFEDKIKVFISRTEYEKDLQSIKDGQDEIKADLKILIRSSK